MTRRDYIATSRILNEVIDFMHPAAYAELVDKFSEYMKRDNEKFDIKKFEEACYA